VQPSYDSVNCMLEPYIKIVVEPYNPVYDCHNDINLFLTTTKTWNCPQRVNYAAFKVPTDGSKIIIDTNKISGSSYIYTIYT
jgi:hypothetical protein